MSLIIALIRSSLGKKYLMAISGLGLFGFVVFHMLGNWQIFLGRETINVYAAFLKSKPALLWGARLGLLGLAAIHIWAAVTLSLANRKARGISYDQATAVAASYASRTMIWSGLILFSFIVFHLLHFTVGAIDGEFLEWKDSQGRHDVFRMVVVGFSHPLVSLFYIFSMGLLCAHLSHGVSSMLQSLGLNSGGARRWIRCSAITAGWFLFVGNSVMPIAILLGYGEEALR